MNLIPVLIVIVLSMVLLGRAIVDHGKPGGTLHVGWALASAVVWNGLFWWAGFYRTFAAPQFIWIALSTLGLSVVLRRHGTKDENIDCVAQAVGSGLRLLLLWWGLRV
jgi:hypothetical protein